MAAHLEALDVDHTAQFLGLDLIQNGAPFLFVQRIEDLLSYIDSIEWGHRHTYSARFDHRSKMFQE